MSQPSLLLTEPLMTRTPAMIHSPAHLPQGVTSDLWLHVTDWYPTILAMAGLSPEDPDLDGINHWAQLQDPGVAGTREEMVYNAFYSPIFNLWDTSPVAAIRSEIENRCTVRYRCTIMYRCSVMFSFV